MPTVPERPFATCRWCGDAVPPGADRCPRCGEPDPIAPGQVPGLGPRARRRFRFLQGARVAVVVAVVVALVVLLGQAAFTPAPVAADPLTQSRAMTIPAGGFGEFGGDVTGSDYIQGNYSVLDPPGALLTVLVFNESEFAKFRADGSGTPQRSFAPGSSGAIVFAALYTNTYHFVWQNSYPADSGLSVTVYVKTVYEPNVVIA